MDLIQAADAVRAAAKKHEALSMVAAELERIGSFQQAAIEAENAHRAAVGALLAVKGEIAVAETDRDEAKAEAITIRGAALEAAANIVAEAEGKALRAAEVAEAQIADKLAAAESAIATRQAAARTEMDALQARIDAAKAELDLLLDQIDTAQKEYDRQQGKIADVRAEINKILGQ